jgi:hypothetical protein
VKGQDVRLAEQLAGESLETKAGLNCMNTLQKLGNFSVLHVEGKLTNLGQFLIKERAISVNHTLYIFEPLLC